MSISYSKMKHLFLRQSYLDAWEDYRRSLRKKSFIYWDYIILTASNEDQAEAYRREIEYRIEHSLLAKKTHYAVLPDPDGKRVGSGGATFNVLKYLVETEGTVDVLKKRILVIHSGGILSVCHSIVPVESCFPQYPENCLMADHLLCLMNSW